MQHAFLRAFIKQSSHIHKLINMNTNGKKMKVHIRGYVLILAVMVSVIIQQPELVTGQARVPALFVLGDSLVDAGNNNFLASVARANYLPYGIDLNFRPTGRFCNGLTFIDLLGKISDT